MFGFRQPKISMRALQMVVCALMLVGAGANPAAATAKKTKCDGAAGWSAVAGRPSGLARLGTSGMYVWNEKGVWRLSVTHGDRRLQKFQGSISFDAPISSRPVGAEGTFGDVVLANGSSAAFTFANYGGVDGVAISAPCATTVTVNGTIDGQPIASTQIFLGANGVNPAVVPAVLTKTSATSTTAAASQTSTTVARECANVNWPSGLQGRPAALKNNGRNAASGMYLWAEKSILKVAIVGEQGKTFDAEGSLTANAEVRATPVGLEGRKDALRVEGNTVTFNFKTSGNVDGFDLVSPCATQIVVEATLNDAPITLFLGSAAAAVPALPYLVTR